MGNLGMWNGSTWSAFGNIGNGMGNDVVNSMCIYNGELYVGGNFSSCGGNPSNNIGIWNGSSWSTIGTGINGPVQSLSVYRSYLYIGGVFTSATGINTSNVARYSVLSGIEVLAPKDPSLIIYPNPASDFIEWSWKRADFYPTALSIYDAMGRKVFDQSQPGSIHKTPGISVKDWNKGSYFIKFTDGKEVISGKFLIKE